MITSNVKRLTASTIYNARDFSESGGSGILVLEQTVTINSDFDESQFVLQKTGVIMTGDLTMEGLSRIIFTDGSTQFVAFDEGNVQAVIDR
jgi:predicted transcriptional regulator